MSDEVQQERARLAAALHDTALQSILAARQELLATIDGDTVARATAALDEAVEEVRAIFAGTDVSTATQLTPAEEEPMMPLLMEAAARAGFTIHLGFDPGVRSSHPVMRYIARECVTNAAKHARAQNVWIHVSVERNDTIVVIRDDGVGMAAGAGPGDGHIGLTLLRTRVQQVGGTMSIDSSSEGTTVTVRMPLSD